MSTDYMDKMRGQAQAELESVNHLKAALAAVEATIQEYEEKLERAAKEGEETQGFKEILKRLKREREELKKKLKSKKRSGDSDEDDEKKKSKGRRKLVKPSLHKLLRRGKPRRRGTGRVTPDYMYRLLRTKHPFVSRSLKTKISDSSACKHPGLGLGPKSLSRRSGEEESRESPHRIMEPSLTPGSEHWDKLEEELTKAQNRGDVEWEEGCFTPMDVQARLHTPIDGVTPYDALLMRWEDRVEEHFPSEERNRWSYDDYWGRFMQFVNRLSYDEIEAITREWAANQPEEKLHLGENQEGCFALGGPGTDSTPVEDSPDYPMAPEQNPLGPKREPVNPYYQGLENPLKKYNPLKPNPREDGYQ